MKISKTLVYIIIFLVIIISHLTNIDIKFQNLFFLENHWLISRENVPFRWLFYKIPKLILIMIGSANLLIFFSSFYIKDFIQYRKKALIIFSSIIMVPLVISILKVMTNIYCPSQLYLYGGDKPYVKLLDYYPESFNSLKRGRCYPAGHASGGFSLFCLFYIMKQKKLSLLIALFFGWVMGFYQIMTGSHFISDTIISMLLAWIIVQTIVQLVSNHKYFA